MRTISLLTLGAGTALCADRKHTKWSRVLGPALVAFGALGYIYGEGLLSIQDRLLVGKGFIMPSLRTSVTLSNCPKLTNTMFEQLSALPNLKELVIENCAGLTDRAIESLQKLPNLERIIIRDCSGLTDHSLFYLSKISTLKELELVGLSGLNGEGLMCIGEMENLHTLVLQSLPINDAGLAQMEIPPSLENLTLSHLKQIEGTGFSALKETSLKKLAILDCPKLNEKGWNAFRKIDASSFEEVVIRRCGAFEQLVFPATNFSGKVVVESSEPAAQPAA